VIHPFEQTIVRQFEKRTLLFDNNLILPSFTLKTLRAVQSLADEKNGLPFSNWFDALNSMKSKMEHIDFDVAIIGAGAYGFFLAEHCKSLGKTAIHMGGATQVLFGIKGKRWEDPTSNDCLTDLMNKYWVYPSELERPKGASRVENGCYW
jgi:hypothetical protein